MSSPTKTAAFGVVESHGEDFVHYIGPDGGMKSRIDFSGVTYGTDFTTSSGISLSGLQSQINAGIPNVIDEGTF